MIFKDNNNNYMLDNFNTFPKEINSLIYIDRGLNNKERTYIKNILCVNSLCLISHMHV